MKLSLTLLLWCLGLLPLAAAPFIGYCYPAGAQRGQTVEVMLGGQQLGGMSSAITDSPAIKVDEVKIVANFPRPGQEQRKYLVRCLRAIERGEALPAKETDGKEEWVKHDFWDRIDHLSDLEMDILRRDLLIRRNPLQLTPAINQNALLKITVAPDAAPGLYHFRLAGNNRVSNSIVFMVSDDPEVNEPIFIDNDRTAPPLKIKVPCVVNGRVMPGETDSFDVSLNYGTTYYFNVAARKLIPFLGDAVPGYFKAVLTVTDSDNKVAAQADYYYFEPDPLLVFKPAKNGVYHLNIRDALYRGRADFVYRISVDTKAPARVKAPQNISGTISRDGKVDEVFFEGKKGESKVIEVLARRLGSPLDSKIVLYGPDGSIVGQNDDYKRANIGENVHHADSYLMLVLPADGKYRLTVTDVCGKGGKDYFYRLRLGPPEPDFQVYLLSSTLFVPVRRTQFVPVLIERKDGFDGPIRIKIDNSDDFALSGNDTLPAGAVKTAFTVKSLKNPGKEIKTLAITAEADINGVKVSHPVIAADEYMQAFAYTHLILSDNLYAFAVWTAGDRFNVTPDRNTLKIARGANAEIICQLDNLDDGDKIEFELNDPPVGVTMEQKLLDGSRYSLTVSAGDKAVKGEYNLIVKIRAALPPNENRKRKNHQVADLGSLPVIRLVIE